MVTLISEKFYLRTGKLSCIGSLSDDKRVNLPKRYYNPKTDLKTDQKWIEMKGEIENKGPSISGVLKTQ